MRHISRMEKSGYKSLYDDRRCFPMARKAFMSIWFLKEI